MAWNNHKDVNAVINSFKPIQILGISCAFGEGAESPHLNNKCSQVPKTGLLRRDLGGIAHNAMQGRAGKPAQTKQDHGGKKPNPSKTKAQQLPRSPLKDQWAKLIAQIKRLT
eukprot:4761619-Amphidinium_carterae.1